MSYFLELVINGAFTGLMYSMVALGIVLIYKSSGVLNFAQGALVMMGGYIVWLLNSWGLPIWLAALAALVVMFVLGIVIERLLLRTMVGQPIIMIVMLTLGLYVPFARVRRLRYFHANTLIDGHALGFHGNPCMK